MSILRTIAAIPAGRWTKWVVVGFWLVVLVVAYPLQSKLTVAEKNDASAWLPASAESVKVLDVQTAFQPPNTYPGVVVYYRASGLTAADRAKAAADARQFAGLHGVLPGQVVGPIPSADGTAMQTVVPIDVGAQGWNGAIAPVLSVRTIAASGANGMATHVTGPLGYAADNAKVYKGISSTLLFAALAVVIVILLITYRSPALWLLPVTCSGVALMTADAVVYLLAAHAGLTVNEESAAILDVLVFGASTDYALLIVARYREELRRHDRRHLAMAEALHRAGPAIIASGGTVIVALLMLSFAQLGSTKGLGPVLAIGVGVGMLAMLTLLPALLVIVPRGVFWPYKPRYGSAEPTTRGLWARVGWAIAPRPRLVWITTAVLLGVLALGLTGLKASGLTNAQSFRGTPDSVAGETLLAAHFPAGAGQPVIVIGSPATAAPLRAAFAATPGIAHVSAPVTLPGYVYLQGTLTAPPDSQAAYDTIDRVRAAVHAVPGARALVGGQTAINLDVARASAHDRNLLLPLILAVVLVILAILLRALTAPLILTATVVLSFAAALGVSAFFFNHVFGFGGADTSFPLLVYVFLVALGIDYNIFLMTRVREEAHRRDARRGAIAGLAATGGVITSAGFVLAGTFAVLATIPSTFTIELGFAVAFGILLDTIIVRSVLVTALNLDLGRWMWWPSKLARRPDPAPAELGQERTAALAGEMALPAAGSLTSRWRFTMSISSTARAGVRSRSLILTAMIFAVAMTFIDQTIVAIAAPTIQHDLGLSSSGIQWAINAYLLTLAALFAFGGRLADIAGHRRMVVLGVIIFAGASALCGATPSGAAAEAWLVAFRAVQGVGAAIMFPAAIAIVVVTFDLHSRGRALALFFGLAGALTAVGPIVGGYLIGWNGLGQNQGWRAIFWINIPVALIALALIAISKPANEARPAPVDYRGLALIVPGVGLSVFGFQQATQWNWSNPAIWASIAVGVVLLIVFFAVEARTESPLINVAIFRNQAFTVENIIIGTASAAFIPVFFFAALYGQIALAEKADKASLLILWFFLGFVVCAQIGGRLLDRIGAKRPVVLGSALAAVGFGLWASKVTDLQAGAPVVYIIMAGAGMGLMLGQANTDAINRASRYSYGEATGITQTVRNYGASLGFAILGTVLITRFRSAITVSLTAKGLPGPAASAEAAKIAQLQGSNENITTIPQFIQADFASAIRDVLFGMCIIMAIAAVIALLGLRRGVQEDTPADQAGLSDQLPDQGPGAGLDPARR